MVNGSLGVLLIAGVGVGYLSLTGGDDPAGASATRTVGVTRGTVAATVSASGSAGSDKSRSLDFGTSGTVSAIYVQAGDKVMKGKLLAKVDQSSAKESVRSAKASLSAAEAGDTSTASGYSSYVSAKNSYDQAERQLAGTELTAPFSGTVIAVNGTVGPGARKRYPGREAAGPPEWNAERHAEWNAVHVRRAAEGGPGLRVAPSPGRPGRRTAGRRRLRSDRMTPLRARRSRGALRRTY